MSDDSDDDVPCDLERWTTDTIAPRYIAAVFENFAAIVLGIAAAKTISDERRELQVVVSVVVFLGYFLVFEAVFHRTPGKWITGLSIVAADGQPCKWWQSLIRTVFRILEVNPLLLGALPAALCIILSSTRRRLGDKLAGTLVVRTDSLTASQEVGSDA